MKEKFALLMRWWYLLPLLIVVLSAVGIYLFTAQEAVFHVCLFLSVLLLLLQPLLLFDSLVARKWWRALGIFAGGAVSAAAVFLCIVVYSLNIGMDRVHGPDGSTAVFDYEDDAASCHIEAAMPDSALGLAVGEWMDEQLGGYFTGDASDMQAVVDFYGNAFCDTLRQALREGAPSVEFAAEMVKACEASRFVSYSLATSLMLGGAHPASLEGGATFRKSDGRRLSWDIIRQDRRDAFNDLLVSMLCGYFGVKDETELEGMLMSENVYGLPLPATPPCFLQNGIAIVYQQYEIAGYAAGMPCDTIPYERMRPLMTEWAKRLTDEP